MIHLFVSVLLSLRFLVLMNLSAEASEKVEVCATCPVQNIQKAVDLVRPGGTVFIREGKYLEHDIVIQKPMQLVGSENHKSEIDIQGKGNGFIVTADHVTLRGLSIKNSGSAAVRDIAAIRFEGVKRCIVDNNRISESTYAIYFANVSECTVIRNEITTKRVGGVESGSGIHVWQATNIQIVGNKVSGHRDGIYFEFVSGSKIIENEGSKNLRYGLHFMFSNDNDFERNQFISNESGVAVMYSRNITMRANRFEKSFGAASYGLLLKDITGSQITGNLVNDNTTGLFVEGVTRTLIQENDLTNNGWGIRLYSSSDANRFISNNFISNTFEVSAMPGWTTNLFASNYWSQYQGVDLDRNGIGDSPYRPVRLSAVWIQTVDGASLLLKSFFMFLADQAESVVPMLTPVQLVDETPLIKRRR